MLGSLLMARKSPAPYVVPGSLMSAIPAAWGALRLCVPGYTGPLINVRRDSDNTSIDIPPRGGLLDRATLLNFCGAANGFITTVYNQGTLGSAGDWPSFYGSYEPQIVSAGQLITLGGQPAMQFTTSNANGTVFLNQPNALTLSGASPSYLSMVGRCHWYGTGGLTTVPLWIGGAASGAGNGGRGFIFSGNATSIQALYSDNVTNAQLRSGSIAQDANFLASADFDGANLTGYLNGVSQGTVSDALVAGGASSGNRLGQNLGANYWPGLIAELVFTTGAISAADRATLEANQLAFFGI